MKEKKVTKVDIWPIISSVMLIGLLLFIFASYQNSRNFKAEMKVLKAERDSLQTIFDNRQLQIDSLNVAILNSTSSFDTVDYVSEINNLKAKYEKRFDIIIINDVDSDLLLFTEWLSQKDTIR